MLAYDYQLLLKHLLAHGVKWAPGQEIIYRDQMRYTYADMYARVLKLASALQRQGVEEGTKVGVIEWDSHRYLEMYFGIPGIGAILHTINPRLSLENLAYTMAHAEDKVLIFHEDFLPLVEQVLPRVPSVRKTILITDREVNMSSSTLLGTKMCQQHSFPPPPREGGKLPLSSGGEGWGEGGIFEEENPDFEVDAEYEEFLAGAPPLAELPELDENTQATLSYTTGTTGKPKGVYFTQRQLVLHTFAGWGALPSIANYGPMGKREVYMPLTPMFHVHAWGVPYWATVNGIKQVYPGKYEPELLLRLIVEEGATFSHCIPTILQMVLAEATAQGQTLNNWRVVTGGAQLTKGLAMQARQLGVKITGGYGLSESCPLLTIANLKPFMEDEWDEDKQLDWMVKTGVVMPLVQIRVVGPDGADVARDGAETGEIVVRSPWLTPGYYKDPERSEELWAGGWMHTGDVAHVDEYGYIQIVDRIKDVIKSGGEWIVSLELENLLSVHEEVLEAAVIGVPDEQWGERPLAVIVPKEGAEDRLSPDVLRAHLQRYVDEGAIVAWAMPDRYEFVSDLPRTSVGKIDKKQLRSQYSG